MTGQHDLVVIGAGIHGAGAAQAAAAAGYSVLVLEQTGIASATSCRSSKLIHGGLRYLESGQLNLVRESLRERDILLRIAPQLVRLVPFHIPIYHHTARRSWQIRAGLSLYALLGGLRQHAWFASLPRSQWEELDGLATENLQAVFRYQDAQTDDAALTQAVMRSAQSLGAELVVPGEFLAAQRTANGYAVRYRTPLGEAESHCTALVNATGPWINTVLARITPRVSPSAIELVQGTHIVLDGPLQRGAYYTEAEDGRAVFVMPWRSMTLVGTTETRFSGDPAQVRPLTTEVEYLLRTFRRYFPERDMRVRDQFAGLRVLPLAQGAAFHRPRETLCRTDAPEQPRLVSIYGGKLTGYRATAQKALALLRAALPVRQVCADTATLRLED
ncbi:MAG TPA: FAD-dependent oxidoreductase [Acidiferrobacterales bacterium]|nr:FAD-dependent oxidoreductase [Acidiferrobacterales bacterium]